MTYRNKDFVLVRVDDKECLMTNKNVELKGILREMSFYTLISDPRDSYSPKVIHYRKDTKQDNSWGTLISAIPFNLDKNDSYHIESCVVIKSECDVAEYDARMKERFLRGGI